MARRTGEEVQRCQAISTIQRMIGGKWKIEILFYVAFRDVRHFGQLRRCIGGISESTLSRQLRELVDDGFLTRIDHGEVPPNVAMLGALVKATGCVSIDSLLQAVKIKIPGKAGENNAKACAAAYENA